MRKLIYSNYFFFFIFLVLSFFSLSFLVNIGEVKAQSCTGTCSSPRQTCQLSEGKYSCVSNPWKTNCSDWLPGAGELCLCEIATTWTCQVTGGGSDCTDDMLTDTKSCGGVGPTATPPPGCTIVVADVKANGSDGPISVASGENFTLSWSGNDGSCSLDGVGVPQTGSQTRVISSSQTFSFRCDNGCDVDDDTVTVNVSACPAAPSGFSYSCNAAANQTTISWNPLSEVEKYMLRMNKAPYGDWVGPGDFAAYPSTNSVTVGISPSTDYQYDVQGIMPGESYPYCGGRAPFATLRCNPPTPTPPPPTPTTAPVTYGCVSGSCVAGAGGQTLAQCQAICGVPPCSCTATLSPASWSGSVGSAVGFWTGVNNITPGCSVSRVNYASSNNAVMSMNPLTDFAAPYTSVGTANSPGNAIISSQAVLNDGNTCSDSSPIIVSPPPGDVNCTLTAAPNSGVAPLNSNLTGTVGGTATGDIRYRFDCDGNGTYEHDFINAASPQTRPCTYSAGNYTARLRVDRQGANSTCTTNVSVAAPPRCNLGLNLNPVSIAVPQTSVATATVNPQNGTVDRINFTTSNPAVATINPNSDATSPYQTTARGVLPGTTNIRADCIMGGVVVESLTRTLTVTNPTCTVNLSPPSAQSGITKETIFEAFVPGPPAASGPIQNVTFTSSSLGVATVNPASDAAPAYVTTATGVAPGNTTITARAFISGLQCGSDTSVLTIAAPTCTLTLSPANADIELGASQNFAASVTVGAPYVAGDVTRVDFATAKPAIASANPASDFSIIYQTSVTGLSIGDTTLKADAIMFGASVCNDTAAVNILNPSPWWQVKEGDAVAATGDIKTDIPFACTLPVCQPYFIINDATEDPGVPSYDGSISFGEDLGAVSTKGWSVQSAYLGTSVFTYEYFENKLPVTPENIGSTNKTGNSFSAGGAQAPPPYGNYYIYRYDGASWGGTNLTIDTSDINISGNRRVILFVKNAGVKITRKVNVDDGTAFFMVISQGNIQISRSVGGPSGSGPHIEGIYFTDGVFRTGTNGNDADIQLVIRGSVVSMSVNGIDLQRDLADPPTNAETPAEVFEFAPDQILLYPPFLGARSIQWREVAP